MKVRSTRPKRARSLRALAAVVLMASGSGTIAWVRADGAAAGGQGTFDVRAAGFAQGINVVFSRPGSAPVDPIMDLQLGSALGRIDQTTGDVGGFSSAVYPGNFMAGMKNLLPLLGFPVLGQVFPADHPVSAAFQQSKTLVPPYPLATESSYPGNPGRRVDLLGDVFGNLPQIVPFTLEGATQETIADQDLSIARAVMSKMAMANPAGLLGPIAPVVDQVSTALRPYVGEVRPLTGNLVEADDLRAAYEAFSTGTAARGQAETVISRLGLFGGLLELGRVRVVGAQEATPQGVRTTENSVHVDTVRVLGIRVTIDERGLLVKDQRIPRGSAGLVGDLLTTVLRAAGIEMVPTSTDGEGPRATANALRIKGSFQEPEIPGVSAVGRRSVVTVTIGQTESSLEAFPATDGGGGDALFDPSAEESPAAGGEVTADPGTGQATPGAGPSSDLASPDGGAATDTPPGSGHGALSGAAGTSPGSLQGSGAEPLTSAASDDGLSATAPVGQRRSQRARANPDGGAVEESDSGAVGGEVLISSKAVSRHHTRALALAGGLGLFAALSFGRGARKR